MSLYDAGSPPAWQQGDGAVSEPWRLEESAAERFLRGAVAADPRLVSQALRAALRSAPTEAESLIALAMRLVPKEREAIRQMTAAKAESPGEA
ncbi:MAG: hypothetical protein RIB84_23440 [Sneathiellaceae bacterium]